MIIDFLCLLQSTRKQMVIKKICKNSEDRKVYDLSTQEDILLCIEVGDSRNFLKTFFMFLTRSSDDQKFKKTKERLDLLRKNKIKPSEQKYKKNINCFGNIFWPINHGWHD